MKTVDTYTATIYVGTREHDTINVRSIEMAREFLQNYVDEVGLCVTISPTEFIYTKGSEPGIVVGLINYPRFPAEPVVIYEKALTIAKGLMQLFHQWKVSVVFPDKTIMIEDSDVV